MDMTFKRAVAFTMYVDLGVDLSDYTSGLTYTMSSATPSVVLTVNNADITQSDPQSNGYNTAVSFSLSSSDLDLSAGKYTHNLRGDDGSSFTTLFDGDVTIETNEIRGAFVSGDGTDGDTGTITLSGVTTITVKDGIVTGWS